MDLRKIKKLIEMLQESDLNEIEVKEGEESVRINRKKESIIHTSIPSVSEKTSAPNNDENNEQAHIRIRMHMDAHIVQHKHSGFVVNIAKFVAKQRKTSCLTAIYMRKNVNKNTNTQHIQ